MAEREDCAGNESRRSTACHRPRRRGIQYPETSVIEPMGRRVLDAPHARGMTGECVAGGAPSQLPRIGKRKRTYPPRVLVQDQRARDRRLGALAAVFALAKPAVDADGCAFRLLQIHAGGIDEFRRMTDLAAETNREARAG